MEYNVVGISGSPVRDENVQTFLNHMLDHAKKGCSNTQAVYLSDHMVAEHIRGFDGSGP
jgi:multimeric flavodoxin WrbA